MTQVLGRLEPVPLREVWPHEANDFTPWLAEPDNLALLGESLRLGDLQVQGTEVRVGNFNLDILARDIEGRVVIIENQFGPTDHTHLGQILTCLAGQEGQATVVWIAETIREEHRAAIDSLNASTIEGFDFFAVEVEALRIGESLPAPWFDVVSKPNDWSRGVGRATRSASAGPMDERQKAYVGYWTRFATFLADRHAPFRTKDRPPRGPWCSFGRLARRGYTLYVFAPSHGTKRAVGIYLGHKSALAEFELLAEAKDDITTEFGTPLDWFTKANTAYIEIDRPELIEKDENEQFAWYLDQIECFVRVFRSRIEKLTLDSIDVDAAPPMAVAADDAGL